MELKLLDTEDAYLLSAAARHATDVENRVLCFNRATISGARSRFSRLTVPQKAEWLLQYLARRTEIPGKVMQINCRTDYPVAVCKSIEEFSMYLRHLMDSGVITDHPLTNARWSGYVSVEGWARLEADRDRGAQTSQAFVAMWFNDLLDGVWKEGIEPGIRQAGYKPLRIDMKEHNEQIDDEIMAEIRRSRLVVVDVTGQRTAVHFEAGFAKGLGIPVVWLCKDDKKEIDSMSFDTRQFNHITWNDGEVGFAELRKDIRDRIVSTIGQGSQLADTP